MSDEHLAHVAPLGREHIALTGDYVWANSARDSRRMRGDRFFHFTNLKQGKGIAEVIEITECRGGLVQH